MEKEIVVESAANVLSQSILQKGVPVLSGGNIVQIICVLCITGLCIYVCNKDKSISLEYGKCKMKIDANNKVD